MATVAYISARMIVDGAELSASLHELNVSYDAEMLDETAFGDTNRTYKGGLVTSNVDGQGHAEFGNQAIEEIMFNRVGSNVVLALFPEAITEGSPSGYAMQAVESQMDIGGAIGELCNIAFAFQSRGTEP
jgi:hypothetical protein